MIELPSINYAFERLRKKQWGTGWLFTQDRNKWSVNRPRAKKSLLIVGGLILVFQLCDVKPVLVRDSPFPSPSQVTPNPIFDIARLPIVNRLAAKKGGGRRVFHLSRPELVSRPLNLGNIPPGSMFAAVLASGASNGLVRAEVKEPLRVNGETLIPEGAVLVGTGTSTEERLFIKFNQVVFQDGAFASIDAEACDKSDKTVGLKGSKIGNKALNIIGSLGLNFAGGFSQALQDTRGEQGAVVKNSSIKNALLEGASRTAIDESKELMQDLKNRVPILEVPSGEEICVMTDQNR